ncbi:MAG: hypothetical protein JXX28_12785 [Deltaproteobacteria bacterium]|nr:hypothetical protein [Deltaproteobacteria bacterium]
MRALMLMAVLVPGIALGGDTAGLLLSGVGGQTASRHVLTAGVGAWYTTAPRPWSVTGEVMGTGQGRGDAIYRYQQGLARISAVGGVALGTHATTFHAGVGPALLLARGTLDAGDERWAWTQVRGGVRGRVALDGPLGRGLGWTWSTGVTGHDRGADWDAGLGLGAAW